MSVEVSTPSQTSSTPPPVTETTQTGTPADTTNGSPASTGDAPSISAHAAAFDPSIPAEERKPHHSDTQRREKTGEWRNGRHRSQRNQAGAGDVPRINELTKNWRQEQEARQALEAKYAALEKEFAAFKAPKAPEAPTPPPKFEKPAPKFESFTGDDPLPEFIQAAGAYGAEKHAADAAQARFEAEQKAYEEQTRNAFIAKTKASAERYAERLTPFKATHPDFDAVIAPLMQGGIPPVLELACLEDDKGPEFAYALGTQPGLRAEMLMLSDGRAITDANVALLRQVLASRVQTAAPAASGSVAPAQSSYTPPKPPNPVRTGAIKTADNPLDSEPTSIADHARHFAPKRR